MIEKLFKKYVTAYIDIWWLPRPTLIWAILFLPMIYKNEVYKCKYFGKKQYRPFEVLGCKVSLWKHRGYYVIWNSSIRRGIYNGIRCEDGYIIVRCDADKETLRIIKNLIIDFKVGSYGKD